MENVTKLLQIQFDKMCATGKLFRSSISTRVLWTLYLNGFGEDPIFRDPESSKHNCNLCNNFIRRYGNIVAVDTDGNILTLFDIAVGEEYKNSFIAMSIALKKEPIQNVFFETFNELNALPYESCNKTNTIFKLGINKNVKRYTKEEAEKFGVVRPNEIRTFHHFHLNLPAQFVDKSGKSIEQIEAFYRDKYQVFKRAMEEIPLDTLNLVRDLIKQGSLLDGDTHLFAIEKVIGEKNRFELCKDSPTIDYWLWVHTYSLDERVAKFKNTLIGVLCTELAEGEELNKACLNWNKRVDPANYMKAVAPITKKQIEEAKKFVEENGYEESFNRRFAVIDDINVSEILHSNIGDGKIKEASIFKNVKATTPSRHKRSEFDKLEEVPIEKFMKDILPSCTSIEVFLENGMQNHLVTLTTANNPNSKPIFKWDNNYSWTFNGNLAGKSQIKQAVEDAGGNVDGILNFRLAWNDSGSDNSDLDAWAQEPNGTCIGYSSSYRRDNGNGKTSMTGQLDLDNTGPGTKMGVENITWFQKDKMKKGRYLLWVNQYSARNSEGFKAEIEFGGNTYSYALNKPIPNKGNVKVAEVTLHEDGTFTIHHFLPEINSSKKLWNLDTNNFHKVNLVCLTPNHWGKNEIGNKHYLFMLDNCNTDTSTRSFHNENLIPELLKHRKVMEVLGATNMLEPNSQQLSGIGFNATVRDQLIVRLQGTHKRAIKLKF